MLVQVRDAGVQGQELLSPSSSFESQVLPFSSPGRAVRLLNEIVAARGRGDLNVLHGVEHGKFPDGRTVAPQLVRVDDLGHIVLTEQSAEEAAGSYCVAVRLEQDLSSRQLRIIAVSDTTFLSSTPRGSTGTRKGGVLKVCSQQNPPSPTLSN